MIASIFGRLLMINPLSKILFISSCVYEATVSKEKFLKAFLYPSLFLRTVSQLSPDDWVSKEKSSKSALSLCSSFQHSML